LDLSRKWQLVLHQKPQCCAEEYSCESDNTCILFSGFALVAKRNVDRGVSHNGVLACSFVLATVKFFFGGGGILSRNIILLQD
jgi:hypothetical protein